jgi:hypothetical protein
MTRKSTDLKKQLKEAVEKAQAMQETVKLAEQEEEDKIKKVKERIERIMEEEGMFCGVVLAAEDLGKVVQLAIEKHDNIEIPFMVYYKK